MVNEEFNSPQKLYEHIYPALHSKCTELRIKKMGFVTEKMLWKILKETKWKQDIHLTLFDIVRDIFNIDEDLIFAYLNKKKKD